MAKVIGLGGILFKSSNPKALAHWYQKHLQLPVESWGGAAFYLDKLSHYARSGYSIWSPMESDSEYLNPSQSSFMINLVVDDLTEALAQVQAGGCEVLEISEPSEFGRFGWFIDPDGNKVELWQPNISP
ncbi:VOC family protein [Shewanella nanhaiensis]|uniref:VOC family protein n=1 Tax=Shewanella nanhaiensis TaxID=2864872 RepID=A0ABS7DXR8_9GAMM|nr:VOC family protein [Shewanella nanhaiensis]MBW8182229.1 VOC family protein [Shewanella nanhaiensis]